LGSGSDGPKGTEQRKVIAAGVPYGRENRSLPSSVERGTEEVPIGEQLIRESGYRASAPKRGVEATLDTATDPFERSVGLEKDGACSDEQHDHGRAQVGSGREPAVDGARRR